MRYFLIIQETMGMDRTIDILDSTDNEAEAVPKLIAHSNKWEDSIVTGKCKVYMTTYIE